MIDNFGQGNDFNIRGIGKAEHNSQTTVGVVTYRDGVATFPGYFQEEPYYDIATVEILRGPQGTFGGQNATGGAVFVNTNDPVIGGGYDGYVPGQVGNYSDFGTAGRGQPADQRHLGGALRVQQRDRRDSFYNVAGPNGGPYTGNPGNLRDGQRTPRPAVEARRRPDRAAEDRLQLSEFRCLSRQIRITPRNDLFNIGVNSPQQALDRFGRTVLKIDYVLPDGITLRSVTGYQKGNTAYQADLDGTNRWKRLLRR